jgi:hypothetical protein
MNLVDEFIPPRTTYESERVFCYESINWRLGYVGYDDNEIKKCWFGVV